MSIDSLFPSTTTTSTVDFGPNELAYAARIAGAIALDKVTPTSLEWLWPGRIPLGHITMLASDPGLGRSLLTLDVAARVSRGTPWPDEPPLAPAATPDSLHTVAPANSATNSTLRSSPPAPASVVLLTAEDDLADTIRPRLEAMGADCKRIVAIPAVPCHATESGAPRAFELRRDLA